MVRQYMEVRLTVIGSSPAWPNPGSAQSGYLLEGEGSPPPRLRARRPRAPAGARLYPGSIAITHFHLDHWGDLVPWAWLNAYGPQEHRIDCSLWLPAGGIGQLHQFASRWGNENMFEEAFALREFEPGVPFTTAGLRGGCLPAAALRASARTGSGSPTTARRSRTRATRRPRTSWPGSAQGADLFLCEATLSDAASDGLPRGHLSAEEALAAADGPVLLTHRPIELPPPNGVPVARDGLVVQV